MSLFMAVQAVLLTLLALFCLGQAISRLAPRSLARLRLIAASRIDSPVAAGWRRALARRLAPARTASGGGACGSGGCSACAGCGLKTGIAPRRR